MHMGIFAFYHVWAILNIISRFFSYETRMCIDRDNMTFLVGDEVNLIFSYPKTSNVP